MTQKEKAKTLLQYGSYEDYIKHIFKKNNVEEFMITEYFESNLTNKIADIEMALVRENWEDNKEEYLDDGYTKDDIEYEDYDEVEEELREELILDIADYYINKYFEGDNDLFDDMEKLIKSWL